MRRLNQVTGDIGGAVLRVSLAPHIVMAAVRYEHSDADAEDRKFLIPAELLKHAYVARVSDQPQGPSAP